MLHVDERDARAMGLAESTFPDDFGTFRLDPRRAVSRGTRVVECLDHPAPNTRGGVQVGVVRAGECPSNGNGPRVSVRVAA